MRGLVFGVLGGVCALASLYVLSTTIPPTIAFSKAVGAPGPHDQHSRSPGLAMDLAFSGDDSRIIVRQENGDVVAWDLASGAPDLLGQTAGAFAYCAAEDVLATGDETGISLTALKEQSIRRVSDDAADYAAMSDDCAVLALASEAAPRIRIQRLTAPRQIVESDTRKPVRNGLAISTDGARIAAATGSYDEQSGHDADIETFVIPPWGPATAGPVLDDELIVGMWRMAFSPNGAALFAGSQANGKSGLRAISVADGAPFWGYDGFKSYWVRGLAASPTGEILATGDETGMLRLWNARTGEMLYEGKSNLVIQSLAFSSDGSMLAVGLWDATIGILDVAELLATSAR